MKISVWDSLWILLLMIGDHKDQNNFRVGTSHFDDMIKLLIRKEKLWVLKGSVRMSNTDIC